MCDSPDEAARVESQMKLVARPMYSNPPVHGALLVKTILQDPALKARWFEVRWLLGGAILAPACTLRRRRFNEKGAL